MIYIYIVKVEVFYMVSNYHPDKETKYKLVYGYAGRM